MNLNNSAIGNSSELRYNPFKIIQESLPVKLHKIIERSEVDGYSSIISWAKHGRAFHIFDENLFFKLIVTRIFPMYPDISTFLITLFNEFGFRRIQGNGQDRGAYYHELFLRGHEELCIGLVRFKDTIIMSDKKPDPDFNLVERMPVVFPRSTIVPNSSSEIDEASSSSSSSNSCQQEEETSNSGTEESTSDNHGIGKRKSPFKKYVDFANTPNEEVCQGIKPAKTVLFPVKLHKIIERGETEGYSDLISWCPHGRSFKIHHEKQFLEKILCRFFYLREIKSFVRQLSSYGFHRIVSDKHPDKGCYYHELFLRSRPGLVHAIVHQKQRALIDPWNEPNFFHYDALPGAPEGYEHKKVIPPISSSNSESKRNNDKKRKLTDSRMNVAFALVALNNQNDGNNELRSSSSFEELDNEKNTGTSQDEKAHCQLSTKFNPTEQSTKNKVTKPPKKAYTDFSKIPDDILTKNMKMPKIEIFPVKLHRIIESNSIEGHKHIIDWCAHGRAFKIHDEKLFHKEIICRYFFLREMKSFIRQLSSYGFHRIVGEDHPDKGCYYHELFLRNRSGLCAGIQRAKHRAIVDSLNEPNFTLYDSIEPHSSINDNVMEPPHQLGMRKRIKYCIDSSP